MSLGDIVRAIFSRVDTIAVKRTALNPVLWLTCLVTPLSLILAFSAGEGSVRWVLLCFAAVPPLFVMLAYSVLLFRDPDRLQSEEYRIRRQALQYLYKKGGNAEIVDVANEVTRLEISESRPRTGEGK